MRFALPALFALACVFSAQGCAGPALGSVGAVLSHDTQTGLLLVHEAPGGLAASTAGIEVGDEVKMIDGLLVSELSSRRIRALLRGPIKSTVTLTIVRGDRVLHLEVERGALGTKGPVADRYQRIE